MRANSLTAIALLLLPVPVAAATGSDGGAASVLGALALVLVAAKVAGHAASLAGQPTVLGELLAGIVLGNLSLVGWAGLEPIERHPGVALLAELGVILLLFEVGLESTLGEMRSVGLSSTLVALLGVIAPFVLGIGVGVVLLPGASLYVHAFLGATLTATSIGITARVLKDLGRARSREARVILGAAVIDDVLGLVVLSVVSGLITAADQGTSLSVVEIGITVGKAFGFLVLALAIGGRLAPLWFQLAAPLRGDNVLLAAALVVCFGISWLASLVGLAPIVGAFAAGLLLERVHYRDLEARAERQLEHLLAPITGLFVPVFFVLMGMRVDLGAFADPHLLTFATVLTIAAVAGKQASALGVVERGTDRVSVGLGMVPRGEVGLIFANVGLGLTLRGEPVIDGATYGAVVVMVVVTTLVTPPALRWSFARG